MWILLGIPALTAGLAAACALWPAARRFMRPVLALAVLNVVLTPLTSGEWFYQRAENSAYEQAVARGDFTAFQDLLDRHDPHLLPRMVTLAAVLLVSVALLAVLHFRADRGKPASAVTSAIVAGTVLLAAAGTLAQVYLLAA